MDKIKKTNKDIITFEIEADVIEKFKLDLYKSFIKEEIEKRIINEVSEKLIDLIKCKPSLEKNAETCSDQFYKFVWKECESICKVLVDKALRDNNLIK